MRPHIHGYNNNTQSFQNTGSSPLEQNLAEGSSTYDGMIIDQPAGNKIYEQPSSVYIRDFEGEDILFNFTTTGSIGDSVGTNGTWISFGSASDGVYGTGSATIARPDQERELAISPTAWSGSSNTAGSVLFIYNKGKNS
jgi:hypothetical protein